MESPHDHAGGSVSGAGDLNGDGVDDVVIGASLADPDGREGAGASYVVFGRFTGFAPVLELSSLLPANGGDGSAGFVLDGIRVNDFSGAAVSGGGDINDDGVDDLLVGAPSGPRPGETYVVFGAPAFPAVFQLASLYLGAGGHGTAGFVLPGCILTRGSSVAQRATSTAMASPI
jgi:hypothetical protein